ncbi:hypothetical protein [Paraburkholderia sp. SOS3]|uniref:hypothetical protein n=1 Tax=Paraburkholderia sp. SOS3 TaxID=1926494 RepID=UPI0009472EFA|nr:hypothetical protein [Paraburkholderia sp. SOS3]APR40030.1 hypothetical protein BTO02_33355 [Paraburkholderia sp. SOS3]
MASRQTDAVTDTQETSGEVAQAENAPANTLGHYLIVRHAFGTYRKGDAIRDEATIAAVLANAVQARNVHKVLD